MQEVGDYEGALKVYQEAQEVFVALYGYEHSEVISAHEYMGLVRDPDKARGIFATAADIRCIAFWPGHGMDFSVTHREVGGAGSVVRPDACHPWYEKNASNDECSKKKSCVPSCPRPSPPWAWESGRG